MGDMNGRPVGNDRWYAELEAEMKESNLLQREAELNLMYHTIRKMRLKDRLSYTNIAKWFEKTYGMSKNSFQSRKDRMRKAGMLLP